MRRLPLLALVAMLAASGACSAAEMTVDEARVLVERLCNVSLANAETTTAVRGEWSYALFAAGQDPMKRRTYRVNLTRGLLRGWSASPPAEDAPARLTSEEALAIAKATARRCMGPAGEALVWQPAECPWRGPVRAFRAHGAPVGEPPYPGLWATCSVEVSLLDGEAFDYLQWSPDPTLAARVKVTETEAVETAKAYIRDNLGWAGMAIEQGTTVGEGQGRPKWFVTLLERGPDVYQGEGPDIRFFQIDAVTGKILTVSGCESAPDGRQLAGTRPMSEPPAAAASLAPARRTPWPLAAGVGAVMLAAPLLAGLVARRRARV